MSREIAYAALFDRLRRLQDAGVVVTCSRRVRLIADVAAAEMPALFMGVHDQQVTERPRLPPRRSYEAQVFLYVSNPDSAEPPGPALNLLLDAVEAALAPSPGAETQTLGGTVYHCRIEGKIEVFEGITGQQAAAIIPVLMLMP